MKLTPAQARVYAELKDCGTFRCSDSYAPAKALVEKGLAVEHRGKFGGYWITPTPETQSHE